MIDRLRDALAAAATALRAVLANADLRRLLVSWTSGIAADAAFLVVVLVVAYDVGGPVAVGLIGLARMLPATAVALFATLPVGVSPIHVLLAINLVRGMAAMLAAVLLAVSGPLPAVVACLVVSAGVGVLVRPTQNALMPALSRSPAELVASNVGTLTGEGVGTFAGPVIAGIVLATAGAAGGALVVAIGFGLAALALVGIAPTHARRAGGGQGGLPVAEGLRALRGRPGSALVLASFGAQSVVRGLLTTLIVVVAIELLGLGEPGVGALSGALGAGGLAGAIAALALAGRRSLAPAFAVALAGWGLPIAVVGIAPIPTIAIAAMLVVGMSNAVLDVAGFTLLQRGIPEERRTHVFRLLEGVAGLSVAFGSVLAPVLVGAFGTSAALGISGSILPIVAVATWRWIVRIDREAVIPERELHVLRSVSLFAPLPLVALERIALSVTPVRLAAGDVLMREGEPGDRYYVIASGRVDVAQDGRHLRSCGPGEGVGEIALLRRIPRTATVVAAEPTELLAVDPEVFITAVTDDSGSAAAADRVVGERLGTAAGRTPD